MILTSDGITGFFNSNRKNGYGGNDIYRVFFKQPIVAQQEISAVPTYYQMLFEKNTDSVAIETPNKSADVKEYFLSNLFIDENDENTYSAKH